MSSQETVNLERLRALSDEIRWGIMKRIAAVDEFPCAQLEIDLPISKPTISYHTKILTQSGLITMSKQGRKHFYTANREAVQEVVDQLWTLAPAPRLVRDGHLDHSLSHRRSSAVTNDDAAMGSEDAVVLTW